MSDDWMPTIELPITEADFDRLPRNAAYKYEYFDGRALLSPRPRHYHALLDLTSLKAGEEIALRSARTEDFSELVSLFADVFRNIQPFGSLDDADRLEAARQALERTHTGGDGPWIEQASFVALEKDTPIGAVFTTLLPDGDPCDWDSYRWSEPPPADCIELRLGRPHLTWIFVSPWHNARGVGTGLLGAAATTLVRLGYKELLSTFLQGNHSSILWHWRNGFRLLSYPGSFRNIGRH